MVLADMANPPEHDFAPAWLKIPSDQERLSKPQHLSSTSSSSSTPGPSDEHRGTLRPRHYSTDSQSSYSRSPTYDQFGFRSRDEHRHCPKSSSRHHSVDELPWDPDPTTNWNYSQFNGNAYGMGYQRRGNSVPRSSQQQYSGNGRFDGGSLNIRRGQYSDGKSTGPGRQRFNSGSKSAYPERDDRPSDADGGHVENGQRDVAEDSGKESNDRTTVAARKQSALISNQDFPSLSGADDPVELSKPTKPSVPSGAWEKPPETNKFSGRRKLQVIKKTNLMPPTEGKTTPHTTTVASLSAPSADLSKVGGQAVSVGQSSKVSVNSNAGSGMVLKSMTSGPPMASSRAKESPVWSAPMPSSRILPITSKPSPTSSKPLHVPIPIRSATSNTALIPKAPAFIGKTSSTTRKTSTEPAPAPKRSAPPPMIAASTTPVFVAADVVGKAPPIREVTSVIEPSTPVLINSSKTAPDVIPPARQSSNRATPKSSKPTGRLTSPMLVSRPLSSSSPAGGRLGSVMIINRSLAGTTNGPSLVGLRSGPRQEKLVHVHTPTLQPLNKIVSPPREASPEASPLSPALPKPKKGWDKLDFLNELRRDSTNSDLSTEAAVDQNNTENLRGGEEEKGPGLNGPASIPKTILQKTNPDTLTNGSSTHTNDAPPEKQPHTEIKIHNFFPEFSSIRDAPDMSNSLEAEKRLLQEMGWHEHSDNEEGYAPITEDELKEFQTRSKQFKKNGFPRALPIAWNNVSLPIRPITQVSLDNSYESSDSSSDSSDDDDS